MEGEEGVALPIQILVSMHTIPCYTTHTHPWAPATL